MDSTRELTRRPLAAFEEHHMKGQAATLRGMAADVSRLSWDLDEALRNVRRAETPEEKAAALTIAREVSTRVNREMLLLGYNV